MTGSRRDRIDEVVAHASEVLSDAAWVEPFIRSYYRHVAPADMEQREVTDLFGAALEHHRLALTWESGTERVAVVNPRAETDGWECGHTTLMVVVDDQPFLVDSISMAMSRMGLGIHLVVHPQFVDHRGSGDGFEDPRRSNGKDGEAVAFVSMEIDRVTDTARLAELHDSVMGVLADVRAVVEDRIEMRDRALAMAAGLEQGRLPVPDSEVDEASSLLRWLAEDHFTFLGARDYVLDVEEGQDVLRCIPGSGLGILREHGEVAPHKIDALPQGVRDRIHELRLLNLTKAGTRATVHRGAYLDYMGVKSFNDAGEVIGERRLLGLFAAEAYNRSVTEIPLLSSRCAEVLERSEYPKGGHDYNRLLAILESYPRDELFQLAADELFPIALGITQLQERRSVRVFEHREMFGRFVTCLVYLPRDRYNTASRLAIETRLKTAYQGTIVDWNASVTDSVLARLVFIVQVGRDAPPPPVELTELEADITADIRVWSDELTSDLASEFGEDRAVRLAALYSQAFPAGYQAVHDPRTGVADIGALEGLDPHDGTDVRVYRDPTHVPGEFGVKMFRVNEISLTELMPTLTNLGVVVLDERPFEVKTTDGRSRWIYDFTLEQPAATESFEEVGVLFSGALTAVWSGEVEDDAFNTLILAARLDHREVSVLRAYARYLRQVTSQYSQTYIEATLRRHPTLASALYGAFAAKFDPDRAETTFETEAATAALLEAIDNIHSLDEDRILRRFRNLIEATVRTSYFQHDAAGGARPYIAFKFDPGEIEELPSPRPAHEIFVHSPSFEGVHLRAGAVARGGLRWSDRLEDYRTEVLGLLKAQIVKNSVIVPVGAKGGFIVKRRRGDATDRQAEVVACYRGFVAALLALTDNRVDGEIVSPERTRTYDGPDSYLVVAADKGTASFSDHANEVAAECGFWLDDAFASGGSHGYDHKTMGITARGAWESVARHFRELDLDIGHARFTAVGIGDMSGDVFGNGMLLAPGMQLVAAFDHRHVFVDPNPDPERSWAERRRLFELVGSSWADYDQSVLSEGGVIFERTAKSVTLSDGACEVLGCREATMTPTELIAAVLRAPVDLLWNGGIGTYVKASSEQHVDAGDKSNDAIRVDASQLRCRVIGEGGNLGLTQRARIEFSLNGGSIYTDAIDNSAGVDTSDREVNLKILLNRVVNAGDLTAKQRNELLAEMTQEVADEVLADNYRQTLALSLGRRQVLSMGDVHARYIAWLESAYLVDRELQALPVTESLVERRAGGRGLTAPELAVLLATTKNYVAVELADAAMLDDPFVEHFLIDYFPSALRERYQAEIGSHPLRREIIANQITNRVIDRAGTTMIYRLAEETSAPIEDIVAAHVAAWELFDLESVWSAITSLDNTVSASTQATMLLRVRQLGERGTRWLIRNRRLPISPSTAIAALEEGMDQVSDHLDEYMRGSDKAAHAVLASNLEAAGVPAALARRVAGLGSLIAAPDVVEVSTATGAPIRLVAGVHFAIADQLDLTWLRDQILELPRDSHWSTLARLTLRGDLYRDHRDLTEIVTASAVGTGLEPAEAVEQWAKAHAAPIRRFRRSLGHLKSSGQSGLTVLLVASREVRNLIHAVGD